MTEIKTVDEAGLSDLDYYRTKNIPATGCYLKKEDKMSRQIQIELK